MNKVIVISAHPDDETLGAGGTLLKHRANGDQLFWIIATSIFENQGFSKEKVKSRIKEIDEVKEMFGFEHVFFLDFPTMRITSELVPELVRKISSIFTGVRPQVIYTLNRSDAHSDHRYISDAVMACTKSFRYPFLKRILMYECISETEFAPAFPEKVFIPNYFVDISEFMTEKIKIMNIFSSEMGEHPFPRSERNIRALGTFRGAVAGCDYAEAFQVVKIID